MTLEDVAVIFAAFFAVSYDWWLGITPHIPSFLQGIVLCCTAVYVAFRAINEIRKFVRDHRDNRED